MVRAFAGAGATVVYTDLKPQVVFNPQVGDVTFVQSDVRDRSQVSVFRWITSQSVVYISDGCGL